MKDPNLSLADVRFSLTGDWNESEFPRFFAPFWIAADGADLDCAVSCRGPDDAVMAVPLAPDAPWEFTVRGRSCEVIRRNRAGETLWHIAAPLTFEQAEVSWNPRLFSDYYESYERAWGSSFGVAMLCLRLRAHGGLVLHGNAAVVDGQAILCVGVSGRGKSTLARLLDAAGATVLTDERPVLRQWPPPAAGAAPARTFRVYGSPWPSSAGFARNAWAPLRRIYFLEHGAENRLTPLAPREAFNRLVHVATIPWQDPVLFDPCLATVDALLAAVPASILAFRPDASAVDLLRRDLAADRGGGA
ncbi:MAG: hypothetical protein FJ222_06945 [Lentisphaerae bacterium]|nr:hypothetical protein [Lentisphaerota bacterium]